MLRRKKKYSGRRCSFSPAWLLAAALFLNGSAARAEDLTDYGDEPLILEPVVQGFNLSDYAYVYVKNGKEYISLPQMSAYLGLKYKIDGNMITAQMADDEDATIIIDMAQRTVTAYGSISSFAADEMTVIDGTVFFAADFYIRLLKMQIKIDKLNMQMTLDREKDFPTTAKLKAEKKRGKGSYNFQQDSFSNYEFDNRWFGEPVVDITLGKGWGRSNDTGKSFNSDAYSVNLAMIAGGLDVNTYIYGDSYSDRNPRVRISGSRTFLDEPENKFNLKTLKAGDISGLSSSYFADASYGRGAAVSSFKNLVMSANKTIDITGPLLDGWQVELYWNEQLVGYRQNGVNGQYNFPNMPVSYGLNTFKLVFYGPYGETRTEYERYYSGTSPVKKGEFGYTAAAYQPYRYLIEDNEPFEYEGKDTPIIDLTGYYGATDNLTLMGGFTQTPDADTGIETQHFGMAGAQYAIKGSSIQYNLEQNLDTQEFGHHAEWQGDVYIGTVYAGYDKFNNIHSPVSFYGDEYLDEQFEARLSGMLPWRVPYYLSWRQGTLESDQTSFNNMTARLSKQLINGLNLTLEDNYYDYAHSEKPYNTVRGGAYKWWGNFSSETWLTYETSPENRFTEFSTRLDWRTGRNTYLSGKYTRNLIEDMDYFSFSGGQVFPFGGLTATLEVDRDFNISSYLTYNISFAKTPDRMGIITSANSKLSDTGTMYVKLADESGNPLEGIGLNANGLEKEVYTDENGVAVLTDLQTYEKTILNVDTETLLDIALQPKNEEKKLVLRPGTVRTVAIPFIHRGAVEGKLANDDNIRMFGYQVTAFDYAGKEQGMTFADVDGFFILDSIPYGTYKIIVSKDGHELAELQDVKIDDVSVYIQDEIKLDTRAAAFFAENDSEKQLLQHEEEHERGFNHQEYRNNDFPIDIPQAVNEPGENIQPIKIEEIEGDIFARADAPVFDSVASVQSYARYMSFAETEKDIFNTGGEDGDAAAVLGDLSRNPALQELIKP